MKKLTVLLAALFSSVVAAQAAGPYLYGDTTATALSTTTCGVYMDSAPKAVAPTVFVGTIVTCKYDLSTIANGSHTVRMTTINNDPTWGSVEGPASAPFAFVKPGPATAPVNLKIGP